MEAEYICVNYQCDYIRLPDGRIILGRDLLKYVANDELYLLKRVDADDYRYELIEGD